MPRRVLVLIPLALLVALGALTGSIALPAIGSAQTLPGEPTAPGDIGPGRPAYAVGRRTIEVVSEPGRTLTADVWYPADPTAVAGIPKTVYAIPGASYTSSVGYDSPPVAAGGPFPLVVYSHGSGGQRFISAFLTEALAARGYVVISADHAGNTAVDQFTNTTLASAEVVRIRPVDIRAEIATMVAASTDPSSPFAGAVDGTRIGLVGHSVGGAGVLQTAAGGAGAFPEGVRAVVGLGAYLNSVTDAQLAGVSLPVMLISGTRDDVAPIAIQTTRAWKHIAGGPLVRVDLSDVGHQSYTDVCYYSDLVDARPGLPDALVQAIKTRTSDACTEEFLPITTAHTLIDRYTIGFLGRYVKGDRRAAALVKADDRRIERVRVKR